MGEPDLNVSRSQTPFGRQCIQVQEEAVARQLAQLCFHSQFSARFDSPWKSAMPSPRLEFSWLARSTSILYCLQGEGRERVHV